MECDFISIILGCDQHSQSVFFWGSAVSLCNPAFSISLCPRDWSPAMVRSCGWFGASCKQMCVVPQQGSQYICQMVTVHEIARTARKQTGTLTRTGDQASLKAQPFASELNPYKVHRTACSSK